MCSLMIVMRSYKCASTVITFFLCIYCTFRASDLDYRTVDVLIYKDRILNFCIHQPDLSVYQLLCLVLLVTMLSH